MTDLSSFVLSRSQQKAEFFDFLDKNRLIFIVLSGRFERLERYFGVLFWHLNNVCQLLSSRWAEWCEGLRCVCGGRELSLPYVSPIHISLTPLSPFISLTLSLPPINPLPSISFTPPLPHCHPQIDYHHSAEQSWSSLLPVLTTLSPIPTGGLVRSTPKQENPDPNAPQMPQTPLAPQSTRTPHPTPPGPQNTQSAPQTPILSPSPPTVTVTPTILTTPSYTSLANK